jgi:CRISPR-associated protein Csm3
MGVEFQGKIRLTGVLTTFTGLSIGKNSMGAGNSGLPRMIVRHPLTAVPFIPASSLRGTIRRLVERRYYLDKRHPHAECKEAELYRQCPVCQIFGVSVRNIPHSLPGRVTIRDLFLTEDCVQNLLEHSHQAYLTDIKVYASMDRVTSQGNTYAVEEIPAGSQFQFEIFYTIYRQEDIQHFTVMLEGLCDLEKSSIGAYGSRGLGKVKFGMWSLQQPMDAPMTAGVSVMWRSKGYYEEGTGERVLITPEEKLGIEGILAEYETRIASHLS